MATKFQPAILAELNALYDGGMVGTGQQYESLIEVATQRTKLNADQVKSWIRRKTFHLKHANKFEVPCVKHVNPWQQHLKNFAQTQEGKDSTSVTDFNRKAQDKYGKLSMDEKQKLESESIATSKQTVFMSRKRILKEGRKVFEKIREQIKKLEKLGFDTFVFGAFEGSIEIIYTEEISSCFSPNFLSYLHAVIVAAKPPPIPKEKSTVEVTSSDAVPVLAQKQESDVNKQKALDDTCTTKNEDKTTIQFPSSEIHSDFKQESKVKKRVAIDDISKNENTTTKAAKIQLSSSEIYSDCKQESKLKKRVAIDDISKNENRTTKAAKIQSSPEHKLSNEGTTHVSTYNDDTVSISSSPGKTTEFWIEDLQLFPSDRVVLLSSVQWLNDSIVNAVQSIIRRTTGHLKSLQSTQLGKSRKFVSINHGEKFLQILHVDSTHWITVSNVNCGCDEVMIYDSRYSGLSLKTKLQICSLVKNLQLTAIKFVIAGIQQQNDSCSCGLFAIAAAVEISHGLDPVKCNWHSAVMRQHLLCCLENQSMELFPKEDRRFTRSKVIINEKLYCECYQVNDTKRQMVQCNTCSLWFHTDCMGLEDPFPCIWICKKCVV